MSTHAHIKGGSVFGHCFVGVRAGKNDGKTQCVDWRFISRRKILVLIQKRIRVDGT